MDSCLFNKINQLTKKSLGQKDMDKKLDVISSSGVVYP